MNETFASGERREDGAKAGEKEEEEGILRAMKHFCFPFLSRLLLQ